MQDNNLIIYKNSEGNIIVDAIYKDETLWLSQKGMSKVFEVGVPAISKHLKNIFDVTEGLENRLYSIARESLTYNDFEKNCQTKRQIFLLRTYFLGVHPTNFLKILQKYASS